MERTVLFGQRVVRAVSGGVVCVYFGTQCVLGYSSENNFWTARRQQISRGRGDNSSLTLATGFPTSAASVLHQFPTIKRQSFTSPLSPEIVKNLPSNFVNKHLGLFNALSATFGTVRRVTLPVGSNPHRIVIHIQDVHQNTDAQRNIGMAIQSLIDHKSAGLVGLEGAFAPIDLFRYRAFPNQKTIREVADYLLRSNKISGPVHTAFTSPHDIPSFVGIDDPSHYKANVEAYRDSAPKIKKYQVVIATLLSELEGSKGDVFNATLHSFDKKMSDYRLGKITLGEYVTVLVAHAPEKAVAPAVRDFVKALRMESSLDMKQVERERAQLIEKLLQSITRDEVNDLMRKSVAYRTGEIRYGDFYRYLGTLCETVGVYLSHYPAMDDYVRYVLIADGIDAEKLLIAMSALEKRIYDNLAKTEEEKILIADSNQLYRISKLLDFSLTPDEWSEYVVHQETHQKIRFGKLLRSALNKVEGPGGDLDLTPFESFYEEAHARDASMASNLLAQMNAHKTNVGVLVTGGYHSSGIEARLKKEGVAIVSFTPKIDKIDTVQGAAYLSVFTREKTPLTKLFQGEKLFLATSPAPEEVVKCEGSALAAMFQKFLLGDRYKAGQAFKDLVGEDGPEMSDFKISRDGTVKGNLIKAHSMIQLLLKIRMEGDKPTIQDLIQSPVKEQWYFALPAVASFCALVLAGPTLAGVLVASGLHILVSAFLWPSFRDRHQKKIARAQELFHISPAIYIFFLFSRYLFFNVLGLTTILSGASLSPSPEWLLKFLELATAGQVGVFFLHGLNNFIFLPASSSSSPFNQRAILVGRHYATNYQKYAPSWEAHIQRSHKMILAGAAKAPNDVVTILGSSDAKEIPLLELATQFNTVNLVDIDKESLQRGLDSIPTDAVDNQGRSLRGKIRIFAEDVTGGRMSALAEEGRRIINSHKDAHSAFNALCTLYDTARLDPPEKVLEKWRGSYVISSGLMSQLYWTPDSLIREAFQEKFGISLENFDKTPTYFVKLSQLQRKIFAMHARQLASLVRPNGIVFWSDTVAEVPLLARLNREGKAALTESMSNFLLTWNWNLAFGQDKAKIALAEQFAKGGSYRLEDSSAKKNNDCRPDHYEV
jgi:hypothetical protein